MLYVGIAAAVVVLGVLIWYFAIRKPETELAPATASTADESTNNYQAVLASLSAESFSYSFMSDEKGGQQEEKRRDRAAADRLLKDPANLQKPLIGQLLVQAQQAMNALVPPEKQQLCFPQAADVDQVLKNIGSVIYDSFQSQADLSDPTYMYSLAALMMIRYSLVAAAEDKRDLITVVKDTDGKVASVVLRPKMARLLSNMVDKVFDNYSELSPAMQKFTDMYQPALEAQFGVQLEDVKAKTRGDRKDAAKKAEKKRALMSIAGRTVPIDTFAAAMVLLASKEVQQKCEEAGDDIAL